MPAYYKENEVSYCYKVWHGSRSMSVKEAREFHGVVDYLDEALFPRAQRWSAAERYVSDLVDYDSDYANEFANGIYLVYVEKDGEITMHDVSGDYEISWYVDDGVKVELA